MSDGDRCYGENKVRELDEKYQIKELVFYKGWSGKDL